MSTIVRSEPGYPDLSENCLTWVIEHDRDEIHVKWPGIVDRCNLRVAPSIPFRSAVQTGIGNLYRDREQMGRNDVRIFLLFLFSLSLVDLRAGL